MKYHTRGEIEDATGDDPGSVALMARLRARLDTDRFLCVVKYHEFSAYYAGMVLILVEPAFPCHVEFELSGDLEFRGVHPRIHDRSAIYPVEYMGGIMRSMDALAEATRAIIEEFA